MSGIVQYIARHAEKQNEIIEGLYRQIVSRRYAPGSRLPSLTEIARTYSSCRLTAQRAMQHLQSTGHVVIQKRLGAFVAENPPHLSHVGVVFDRTKEDAKKSNHHNAFIAEAFKISRANSSDNGEPLWQFSYYYGRESFDVHEDRDKLIEAVEQHRLAGIIFFGVPPSLENTPAVTWRALPRVAVGDKWDMTAVNMRHDVFLEKALDYLLSQGRRRIAFVIYGNKPPLEFEQHVQPMLRRRSMTIRSYWIQGSNIELADYAANAVEALMHCGKEDRPDGLIICDDNLVPAVTQALVKADIDVPAKLEVIAQTNFPYPTPAAVPVKRLGFDVRRLLDACLDRIYRMSRGEEVAKLTNFDPVFEDEL